MLCCQTTRQVPPSPLLLLLLPTVSPPSAHYYGVSLLKVLHKPSLPLIRWSITITSEPHLHTAHRTQNIGHRTQDTEHRTQGTGHRAHGATLHALHIKPSTVSDTRPRAPTSYSAAHARGQGNVTTAHVHILRQLLEQLVSLELVLLIGNHSWHLATAKTYKYRSANTCGGRGHSERKR